VQNRAAGELEHDGAEAKVHRERLPYVPFVIEATGCKNSNARSLMVILVRIKTCGYAKRLIAAARPGSLMTPSRSQTRSTCRCVNDERDHR
jgi:hypothetical protein